MEFKPLVEEAELVDEASTDDELEDAAQSSEEFTKEFAPRLFSQEEVDNLVAEAKSEGYNNAKSELEATYQEQITQALASINDIKNFAETITQQVNRDLEEANNNFVELIKALLQKLTINKGELIIKMLESAVADNLSRLKAIPTIVFKLDKSVAAIENHIREMMKNYEISNFSINIEESRSEVTIAWPSGGLTIDTSNIIRQVEELLQSDIKEDAEPQNEGHTQL